MQTIVALSTPLGVSGIGLVRLSGPNCYDLACAIFKKQDIKPRYSYCGHYHMLSEDVLDDPLFTYFEPNASYTGERMLEISCHGNPLILQQVIRDCIARGCRQAEPGEFTRRAFLNGKLDLCQAEAVEDLIHSQSLQALRIAQKQLSGSLSQRLQTFIDALTDQVAFVEAYLDFPEEDLPKENRQQFKDKLSRMLQQIGQLIQLHQFYTPLHGGIRTAIVGAPNAGKSTLLNLLLGQMRALVSDVPGTTRDFITEWYALDPYTLKLVDTAGIHETREAIERMGIEKSYEQITAADCLLWVVDGSKSLEDAVKALQASMDPGRTLVILNKADLGLNSDMEAFFDGYTTCKVSLKEADNLKILQKTLLSFLNARYQNFSQVEFMVHERHADALKLAQQALQKAQTLLQSGGYDDCLASELKEAIRAFEQITGRIDYERVLDKIFSTFCIGK